MEAEIDKRTIARGVLIDSFWLFLLYGFGAKFYCEKHPEDNWLNPEVHKPLCDAIEKEVKAWEVQRAAGIRKKTLIAIIIPRAYAKSTVITAALSLWLQLRNPDIYEVISSWGIEKSRDFLGVIKTVMEGRAHFGWWKDLWGSIEPYDSRQWTVENITHSLRRAPEIRDPSIAVTSISKGDAGGRPDVFILDDPTNEEKIGKEEDHIKKGVRHLKSMGYALKSNGLVIVCATRYRDYDVPGAIMFELGVREWAKTGARPKDLADCVEGEWYVYFLQARDAFGAPTLPNVYPEERLAQMEKEDPIMFAAQMMNEPAAGGHALLTDDDVRKMWVLPEEVDHRDLRITIHIDTAFKTLERLERGDSSVIAVVGHSRSGDGMVYALEAKHSNVWTADQFFDELVALLQRLKRSRTMWPFALTDEREMGGKEGLFQKVLQSRCAQAGIPMPPFVPLPRQGQRKEVRIRMAADYWRQGKFRLVKGQPGLEALAMQMKRFGFMEHDDIADAFADCFAEEIYFPERVAGHISDGGVVSRRPLDDVLTGAATAEQVMKRMARKQGEPIEQYTEVPWYRQEGR